MKRYLGQPEIDRIDGSQFKTLTGRPCESCGLPMPWHDWADMDKNGFVVGCSKPTPKNVGHYNGSPECSEFCSEYNIHPDDKTEGQDESCGKCGGNMRQCIPVCTGR